MEGALALIIVTLLGNLVVLGVILIPLLRDPASDAGRASAGKGARRIGSPPRP